MTEALKHAQDAVLAHLQPTEVAEPSKRALDFPAPPIPPQLAAILVRLVSFVPAIRHNQLDPTLRTADRDCQKPISMRFMLAPP